MKDKKKTTTRARGLAFQRWIRDWLQEKDWLVHNQTPSGRMIYIKNKPKPIFVSQRNDIFGCFDLIAKKMNHDTLWIQATLHKSLKAKIETIDEDARKYFTVSDDIQIWIKRETGAIDIYWLEPNFGKWELLGKILRRKFYMSEGVSYEF